MCRLFALAMVVLAAAACSTTETISLAAAPPFTYQAPIEGSIERLAVVVTIVNRSQDDLLVNPIDFAMRDRDSRIYTADLTATASDARLVRLAGASFGLGSSLPLASATLRQNDVLVGFVVFDVPAGVRPAQLVFRQADTDLVVDLPESR